MKKYLVKGAATLMIGMVATACTHDWGDLEGYSPDAMQNAEQALGFKIPEAQDWVMSGMIKASVDVNMPVADVYTVKVYSNNPIEDGVGYILAKGSVVNGNTFTSEFRCPSDLKTIILGLTDSKNKTIYQEVALQGGQISATFDASTSTLSASRLAKTRSSAVVDGDPFTFESTDSYYKTAVPTTAKTLDDFRRADWGGRIDENALQGCTEFTFTNGTYAMHCWMGSRDIYVSGNVTLNVDGANSLNQARIYVLPGATLTYNMSAYVNDLEIYVNANATLNYNADKLYKQDGGGKIYSRGTVNFMQDNFEVNQNAIVYNEGTMTAANITSKPGDGNKSFFYNFGTLTLTGKMELNSCANFFNEGTCTVAGETSVTQQKIYWINKGHYTTGTMIFSAKNSTFYNFCQLIVRGNAHMYDGEFNLMDNSYTEAATAEMDNFIVNMGSQTGIWIKGNVDIKAQGDGTYQGFRTSGSNTYVLIGGKVTVASHRYTLSISSGITYSIRDIEIIKAGNVVTEAYLQSIGDGDYPVLDLQGTECPYGNLTVTPNTNDCGANWSAQPGSTDPSGSREIIEENQTWSYAFEDSERKSDYDMNDVVIKVRESESNSNMLIVTLVAAGCEYDNEVYLNNELITFPLGSEVHDAFGQDKGVMINTNRGVTANPVFTTITKPAGFDFQTADFSIVPNKGDMAGQHIRIAKTGQYPTGIVIPYNWSWPTERTSICDAYKQFKAWAEDVSHSTNPDWYKNPERKLVTK